MNYCIGSYTERGGEGINVQVTVGDGDEGVAVQDRRSDGLIHGSIQGQIKCTRKGRGINGLKNGSYSQLKSLTLNHLLLPTINSFNSHKKILISSLSVIVRWRGRINNINSGVFTFVILWFFFTAITWYRATWIGSVYCVCEPINQMAALFTAIIMATP